MMGLTMNLINETYQLCVLSHFTWMVVPIMNLISETYQLYEMRKYAFIIFREYTIISLFVVHNYLRYIIEYFSRVKAIKLGLLYMKNVWDKSCWLIYFKSLVMWHDFYLVRGVSVRPNPRTRHEPDTGFFGLGVGLNGFGS